MRQYCKRVSSRTAHMLQWLILRIRRESPRRQNLALTPGFIE
ncbi:hypothetical protein BSS2_I0940 [Brucella suis bv. 1 str. S2]|uniref:Uncharacterized protein n=1 Tax=Brucella suis biovar 1 (strain 1330) TaxID=204722 RepID=A0A0H3G7B2_BRUSU|nr:hypothetical protein BR0963 [Brucella suis 1330]AEM18305.1 hypothetical protein BS1330_I0959 [Brucella suis 1330]AEU05973.1 hypothetical protein BSVBI22_A0959 [Brucella suis VBI22]AHN46597.1 hypothetical protein BSS2_I0940 [Brucella suis bv. 1 str. S2]CDL76362.1 unnamed protein product [Brucella canis str. Oliveri]